MWEINYRRPAECALRESLFRPSRAAESINYLRLDGRICEVESRVSAFTGRYGPLRGIDSEEAFKYKFNRDIRFIRAIRIVRTKIDSVQNDSLMTKQILSHTTQRFLRWKQLIENITPSNVREITI